MDERNASRLNGSVHASSSEPCNVDSDEIEKIDLPNGNNHTFDIEMSSKWKSFVAANKKYLPTYMYRTMTTDQLEDKQCREAIQYFVDRMPLQQCTYTPNDNRSYNGGMSIPSACGSSGDETKQYDNAARPEQRFASLSMHPSQFPMSEYEAFTQSCMSFTSAQGEFPNNGPTYQNHEYAAMPYHCGTQFPRENKNEFNGVPFTYSDSLPSGIVQARSQPNNVQGSYPNYSNNFPSGIGMYGSQATNAQGPYPNNYNNFPSGIGMYGSQATNAQGPYPNNSNNFPSGIGMYGSQTPNAQGPYPNNSNNFPSGIGMYGSQTTNAQGPYPNNSNNFPSGIGMYGSQTPNSQGPYPNNSNNFPSGIGMYGSQATNAQGPYSNNYNNFPSGIGMYGSQTTNAQVPYPNNSNNFQPGCGVPRPQNNNVQGSHLINSNHLASDAEIPRSQTHNNQGPYLTNANELANGSGRSRYHIANIKGLSQASGIPVDNQNTDQQNIHDIASKHPKAFSGDINYAKLNGATSYNPDLNINSTLSRNAYRCNEDDEDCMHPNHFRGEPQNHSYDQPRNTFQDISNDLPQIISDNVPDAMNPRNLAPHHMRGYDRANSALQAGSKVKEEPRQEPAYIETTGPTITPDTKVPAGSIVFDANNPKGYVSPANQNEVLADIELALSNGRAILRKLHPHFMAN